MSLVLSQDQATALREIGAWYRAKDPDRPFLTLGGYAGTGKTTLIAYLRQALNDLDDHARVAFCAYTGKAARVLADTLDVGKVLRPFDNVSTIHSLIYTAEVDGDGHVTSWRRRDQLEFELIVVDEASMVDQELWRDLLSFKVPVLAVGDHGQLPPVGSSFNLMASPQLRLERIWRQEAGSPIIELATLARTTGIIPPAQYGGSVAKLARRDETTGQVVDDLLANWTPERLILCGYNKSRLNLNQTIRSYRDLDRATPMSGDRVVCLRNNRFSRLYNGMTGTIKSLYPATGHEELWYEAAIELDGESRDYFGYIYKPGFGALEQPDRLPPGPDGKPGDLFDYGYALTVHKAQGSQALDVVVFEERFPRSSDEDWRRWLYTAVTRSRERLVVIGD